MATSSNHISSTHPELDLRELMNSLRHACDLDLLRLRTAIDHLLHNPTRILAVRQRLHVGQDVDFWNLRDNQKQHGRITRFKPDQLLILAENPSRHWWVSYAAVLLNPGQAPSAPPPSSLSGFPVVKVLYSN